MADIKLNYSEIGKLLKGPEVEGMMRSVADDIRSNAGDGYSSDARRLSTRWISTVYTDSVESARENMEHNTLLKAIR